MISLDNLTVSYGGWTLFDNISFLINPKDRIGLVGRNGAGKTTLLRIITGEQQPTSGHVTLNGECTIGYLPQTMRVADTTTLAEETANAFDEVRSRHRKDAAGPRIQAHGFRPRHERVFGRLAHAYRAGETAAAPSFDLSAGRADQPP